MIINYLTIDVEDYYHVSAFENVVRLENWDVYESRVQENTKIILDILDLHDVKATFFILGWIAKKFPELVREIYRRGHEIGCHSYLHRLVYNLTPDDFHEDTKKAKDILQNVSGIEVVGYRAPSYSITKKSLWALDILEELGFKYDSSIFPIVHDRYGISDAPRFKYKLVNSDMFEYPMSTSFFCGTKLPVSGGGYFRLFPYSFTRMLLRKINKKEKRPFVFYLHPWEFDPEQPRMKKTGLVSKFRHYNNLDKTVRRFNQLLANFKFQPICGFNSSPL